MASLSLAVYIYITQVSPHRGRRWLSEQTNRFSVGSTCTRLRLLDISYIETPCSLQVEYEARKTTLKNLEFVFPSQNNHRRACSAIVDNDCSHGKKSISINSLVDSLVHGTTSDPEKNIMSGSMFTTLCIVIIK